MLLQLLQLHNKLVGHYIRPCAQHLAKFHKSGPQFGKSQPQPLRLAEVGKLMRAAFEQPPLNVAVFPDTYPLEEFTEAVLYENGYNPVVAS